MTAQIPLAAEWREVMDLAVVNWQDFRPVAFVVNADTNSQVECTVVARLLTKLMLTDSLRVQAWLYFNPKERTLNRRIPRHGAVDMEGRLGVALGLVLHCCFSCAFSPIACHGWCAGPHHRFAPCTGTTGSQTSSHGQEGSAPGAGLAAT